jgi:hypothetical protein
MQAGNRPTSGGIPAAEEAISAVSPIPAEANHTCRWLRGCHRRARTGAGCLAPSRLPSRTVRLYRPR